ncbi:MAG: hypothetical protein WEE66_00295, partial [Actinomycetota bacterium]
SCSVFNRREVLSFHPASTPDDLAWPEGIYKGGEEFPSTEYSFNTIWQGSTADSNLRVYAGAMASDLKQGIVLVDVVDPTSFEHSFKGPIVAVGSPGPLQIVGAKGMLIYLEAADGSTITFDVESVSFVRS